MLDGEPQGGPADTVDDDIEVAAELLDDAPGAQAAQQLPGRGGIADQRGDDSAAGAGELDRDAPDSAGRARDQHALTEYQASDLQRPQRCQAGGGKRGGLRVGNRAGNRGQAADRNRGELRPGAAADQAHHTGARGRPAAIAGGPFDNARDIPAGRRPVRLARQVADLPTVKRRGADPDQRLVGQSHGVGHIGQRDVRAEVVVRASMTRP